jgi:hypothetical protein
MHFVLLHSTMSPFLTFFFFFFFFFFFQDITDQIIAMGYPSEKVEALYRNPYKGMIICVSP